MTPSQVEEVSQKVSASCALPERLLVSTQTVAVYCLPGWAGMVGIRLSQRLRVGACGDDILRLWEGGVCLVCGPGEGGVAPGVVGAARVLLEVGVERQVRDRVPRPRRGCGRAPFVTGLLSALVGPVGLVVADPDAEGGAEIGGLDHIAGLGRGRDRGAVCAACVAAQPLVAVGARAVRPGARRRRQRLPRLAPCR